MDFSKAYALRDIQFKTLIFQMKQLIISAMLLVAISMAHAQTQPAKHLPEKVVITLTAAQVIKMDSAIKTTGAKIDSKKLTDDFFNAFGPLYQQIAVQLVTDTVKQHTKIKQK